MATTAIHNHHQCQHHQPSINDLAPQHIEWRLEQRQQRLKTWLVSSHGISTLSFFGYSLLLDWFSYGFRNRTFHSDASLSSSANRFSPTTSLPSTYHCYHSPTLIVSILHEQPVQHGPRPAHQWALSNISNVTLPTSIPHIPCRRSLWEDTSNL